MATYEDPFEQLFYESMTEQLKLATANDTPHETKAKALNDLQTSFLAREHAEKMHETLDKQTKAVSKVADQAKRLRDHDGES
jgi:uncharacterized membrane protein